MTALDKQVGGGHYKELAIQPIEYCQKNGLNACESNIVKYVTRHRQKGQREDIYKIIHYAELLLEMEYDKEKGEPKPSYGDPISHEEMEDYLVNMLTRGI